MKRGYVDIPDGQMHYRTEGSGEPFVLLHGAQSSSGAFAQFIPLLSPRYRAIAIDYLGHGESDPAPRQYTMADYAQCVLDFLDGLGVQKTNLMGFSTGANVAVEVAAIAPERVDKLILYNCPYWKDEDSRQRFPGDYPPIELEADGSHLMDKWQSSAGALEGAPLAEVQRGVIARLQAQLSPKRGEETHDAVFMYDVQPRLPLVKSPTLVLKVTREGGEIFHPYAEEVKNAIPQSQLLTLPDAAHVQLRPWDFASPVVAFLG